jgi:hypothetical protein
MNKIKRLGLAGILIGSLALGVSGCKAFPVELPNHYQTKGIVAQSIAHMGSQNVFSKEDNLDEKSRIDGEISYLGFVKNDNKDVSVNNINQNAASGGLIAGNAENKLSVYNNSGVLIKIKTSKQEYIFNLKSNNDLPPSIIFEKFKKGDKVSIPTIRKYEEAHMHTVYQGYRILNEIDYIYLEELRKE